MPLKSSSISSFLFRTGTICEYRASPWLDVPQNGPVIDCTMILTTVLVLRGSAMSNNGIGVDTQVNASAWKSEGKSTCVLIPARTLLPSSIP